VYRQQVPRYPETSPNVRAVPGAVYSALVDRLRGRSGETWPFQVGDTWREPAPGCRMEDLPTTAEWPGLHRYAPVEGLPALIDALVDRARRTSGLSVERNEVLVTAGATGGIGAVVGGLVAPGEEVLLLAPYWPLVAGIVRSFGALPVPIDTTALVTPAEFASAVARAITPRTALLYVNTPNNPTGRVLDAAVLDQLVGVARDHDLWLLADEVYEDYAYRTPHVPARALLPERTLAAHSFSKAFGMAGNRTGWLVGPKDAMDAVRKVGVHSFYAAPTAGQLAGARALERAAPWIADARAEYQATGAAAADRLGLPHPEGGTFLFFDVARHLDGRGLDGFLARCADQGILLAPGTSFGPFPTWVRLCFTAVDPQRTLRGVEVLARLLQSG
jgi:N-succinyldiaminopimelate aminotransferase